MCITTEIMTKKQKNKLTELFTEAKKKGEAKKIMQEIKNLKVLTEIINTELDVLKGLYFNLTAPNKTKADDRQTHNEIANSLYLIERIEQTIKEI